MAENNSEKQNNNTTLPRMQERKQTNEIWMKQGQNKKVKTSMPKAMKKIESDKNGKCSEVSLKRARFRPD